MVKKASDIEAAQLGSAPAGSGSMVQPIKRKRGRPPGSKNKPKLHDLTPSEQIAIEESRRIVQAEHKLNATQVLTRAQIKTGVQGGTMAQKAALERIAKLEQKQRDAEDKRLEQAEEYVQFCESLLDRASPDQRLRLERVMLPHPEDVEVDFRKREIRVRGPVNSFERREWRALKADLEQLREDVIDLRSELEREPNDRILQWQYTKMLFGFLDVRDVLPPRHQPEPLPAWEAQSSIKFWSGDADATLPTPKRAPRARRSAEV